ncbi:MAG: hypothetical protein ACQCN5_04320 [Candidatus Bathyarchaeia archaeon]
MGVSQKSLAHLLIGVMLASSLFMVQSSSAQSTIKPDVPEFRIILVKHSYDSAAVTSTDPFTGQTTTSPSVHSEWLTVDIVITNQNLPELEQDKDYSFYSYNGLMFNVRYKGQYTDSWTNVTALIEPYLAHSSGYKYSIYSLMLNNAVDFSSLETHSGLRPQGLIQVPLNCTVDFQVEALYGKSYLVKTAPFGNIVFNGQESGWSNTQSITINEADAVSGPIDNPTVKITTLTPAPTPTQSPTPTLNPTHTPTQTAPNQKMDSITLPLTGVIALVAALALTIAGLVVLYIKSHKHPNNPS